MGKAVFVVEFEESEDEAENLAVYDTLRENLGNAELPEATYYMAVREAAQDVIKVFDPEIVNEVVIHKNAFYDATDRKEVLGQLAGAASVCWDNPGGAGVFHSDEAQKLVEDAFVRLDEIEMDSHEQGTLRKVRDALMSTGVTDGQVLNAINQMHNAGILFRERK
jgi:hypothetical protein